MARLRYDGVETTLGADISSSGATSITFAAALQAMGTNIPTISGGDYLALIVGNEIVYLTAYTSGATSGTISRGQEGTTAATHSNGAQVVHGPTTYDFTGSNTVVSKTTTYTAKHGELVLCDATSGGFTVTLPAATSGREVTVKKTDTSLNVVTVAGASGALIDGDAALYLTTEDVSAELVANGTDWYIKSAALDGPVGPRGAGGLVAGYIDGVLALGAGQRRLYNDSGSSIQIASIRATVITAPTGASIIFDVNLGGVTVFTTQANRPTITAGGTTSGAVIPDVTTWPSGSYLTVDVDQIGSTYAGANATLQIGLV